MDILEEKNLVVRSMSKKDLYWNKVKSYNYRLEAIENYISKACLLFLSLKENTGGISDHIFPDSSRVDFLRIINKNKIIGYRILMGKEESKKRLPTPVPTIEIDLRKAPRRVMKAFQTLEEYFKLFIEHKE